MHKSKRKKLVKGRSSVGKTAIFGALERIDRVLAKVIESTDRKTLHAEVKSKVEKGSNLFTDERLSYCGLDAEQTFRFNERKLNAKKRFVGVLRAVSGKRLTYDELRGYQNIC